MNPTFYKITVCQIITLFGNAALRFALPLYLLRRTDSAALYGSVTALALVPMLLGTLAGGVLADRCRKQKIMAVLDTVSAIGMATAAVILPAAPETPLVLAGCITRKSFWVHTIWNRGVRAGNGSVWRWFPNIITGTLMRNGYR